MAPYIRIAVLLSFLLVQIATIAVQAKVLVPSSSTSAGRYLQDEQVSQEEVPKEDGSEFGSAIFENKNDNDSNNNNNSPQFVPHPDGTDVRFMDQDGTWMSGTIVNFSGVTMTYTIQWDEGDVEEEFSNLDKVDELVRYAEEEKEVVPVVAVPEVVEEVEDEQSDNDEDDKDYDWNNDAEDEDVPDTSVEEDSPNTEAENTNIMDNKDESSPSSSSSSSSSKYQGSVPQDFDFGYTYKYDNLGAYQSWPIGTLTLLEFQDGYYEGKIQSFDLSEDKSTATYVVMWSDDTTDKFVNELEWMDLMVENAKEYEPWEPKTQTYGYPNPDGSSDQPYLGGEIGLFENGAYTITWSNGESIVYNDFDMVDELVNNAGMNNDPNLMDNYEPWPVDTPVSWDFDDGWWDGSITDFTDGTYEVTWNDLSTKTYSNLEKIDQMVQYAMGDDGVGAFGGDDGYGDDDQGEYQYYPIGTIVYAEFDDGWWTGHVDSYAGNYYVIRWTDDSYDNFLPGPEVDEMVENTQYLSFEESGIFPIGTQVYKQFDGDWYWGSIEYNAGGLYTVIYDDGERIDYVSGAEMDRMVARAANQGMSTAVTFFLGMFVLGSFAGVAFFFYRRSEKKKRLADVTEQVNENELDLTEGNELVDNKGTHSEYSDKSDEDTEPAVV